MVAISACTIYLPIQSCLPRFVLQYTFSQRASADITQTHHQYFHSLYLRVANLRLSICSLFRQKFCWHLFKLSLSHSQADKSNQKGIPAKVTTITGIRLKSDNLFWNYTGTAPSAGKAWPKGRMSHRCLIDVPYMCHRCPNYIRVGTSMAYPRDIFGTSSGYLVLYCVYQKFSMTSDNY
jgi:hypothetical protein